MYKFTLFLYLFTKWSRPNTYIAAFPLKAVSHSHDHQQRIPFWTVRYLDMTLCVKIMFVKFSETFPFLWSVDIFPMERSPGHLFDIRNPIFDGTNLSRETSNIIWNVPRIAQPDRAEKPFQSILSAWEISGWCRVRHIFNLTKISSILVRGRGALDNKIWSIVIAVGKCGEWWDVLCVGQNLEIFRITRTYYNLLAWLLYSTDESIKYVSLP